MWFLILGCMKHFKPELKSELSNQVWNLKSPYEASNQNFILRLSQAGVGQPVLQSQVSIWLRYDAPDLRPEWCNRPLIFFKVDTYVPYPPCLLGTLSTFNWYTSDRNYRGYIKYFGYLINCHKRGRKLNISICVFF